MYLNKSAWAAAAIFLTAALTSCNIGKAPEPTPDVSGIYTAAAQTMIAGRDAQLTQTAGAASPTPLSSPTPLASFTPLATFAIGTGSIPFGTPFTLGTPGTALAFLPSAVPVGTGVYSFPVGCNDAMFIGESEPLDGTQMKSGENFDKAWSLQNTGSCAWDDGYFFAFKDGNKLSSNRTLIPISDAGDFTKPGHSQTFVVHLRAPLAPGEFKGSWQMKSDSGEWFGSIVTVDIVVK